MKRWLMFVSGIVLLILAEWAAITKLTGHDIPHLTLLSILLYLLLAVFLWCSFTLDEKSKKPPAN